MEFDSIGKVLRQVNAVPDALKQASALSRRLDRSMGSEIRRLQRIVNPLGYAAAQFENPLGHALAQLENPLGASLSQMRAVLDKLPRGLPAPVRLPPIGGMLPRPVTLPPLDADFVRIGAAVAASVPKFGGYADLFRAVTEFQQWSGPLVAAGVLESREVLLRRFGIADLDLHGAADAQALRTVRVDGEGVTLTSLDARMDTLAAMVQQTHELVATMASKPDRSLLYFLLGILFTVLLELYDPEDNQARDATLNRLDADVSAMVVDQQQTQAQLEQLQQLQAQLLASLAALEPHLLTHQVVRTTTLRLSPAGRADGVVAAGQAFHVLDKQGRWIQIQFHDPANEAPRIGWILKKHAQAVPL